MIIVVILFIIGLFVKGGSPDGGDYAGYVKHVLDTENMGDSAVVFALACATMLGFIIWCTYTVCYAYKHIQLPILKLVRNRRTVSPLFQSDG